MLIVVAGATGNQGGAVVDALLEQPDRWQVRALTRDPAGPAARALAARGVSVVGADMADASSLAPVLAGAYGVFGVQNSRTAGLAGEVRQGVTLVEAARRAGVRHFVYSSVGGAERVRGIPHFDTKWEIEGRLRESGMPATVLRPTTFTDVFTMRGSLGAMATVLGADKPVQMVAVRDIGVFAWLAFEQPSLVGEAVELAGDELTVPSIAAARAGGCWAAWAVLAGAAVFVAGYGEGVADVVLVWGRWVSGGYWVRCGRCILGCLRLRRGLRVLLWSEWVAGSVVGWGWWRIVRAMLTP